MKDDFKETFARIKLYDKADEMTSGKCSLFSLGGYNLRNFPALTLSCNNYTKIFIVISYVSLYILRRYALAGP